MGGLLQISHVCDSHRNCHLSHRLSTPAAEVWEALWSPEDTAGVWVLSLLSQRR